MKYILLVVICFTACKDDSKTYVVVDRFDDKHKYDRLPDTDSMTVYCQLHYEWENIRYYYTEECVKYWMRTLKYF